ncbi:MAG: carbamoyltransferase [Candidatus Shapirobacteria bacterium]|jgi:carbamoyltransferase
MIILGVSFYYHDSAAAIIKDGQIIAAAQEERFTRKKHDNRFPYHAINYCLDSLGIAINEVDYIAFYEKPIVKFERILVQHITHFPKSAKVFFDTIPSWLLEKLRVKDIFKNELHYHGEFMFIPHHLSHAAASYLTSPFQEAAVFTLDGVGEWATTTLGYAKGNQITLEKQINFPHSLGLFYSAMTAYLGFAVNNDEYKVMGLSAYGKSEPLYDKIRKLIKTNPDGSFELDTQYFSYEYQEKMFNQKLCDYLGAPARIMDGPMTPHYENVAAATQKVFEDVLFYSLNILHQKHPSNNLVLSGGSALNSLANGKISSRTPFKNFYITPDPGDGGGSLGAALYAYFCVLNKKATHSLLASAYLGPGFTRSEMKATIDKYKLKATLISESDKLIDKVSGLLVDQKVIGWFQGRMEWGPRALGNRSILAAATSHEMQDTINAKVKHREMFRPFAPVILREKTHEYFETDKNISVSADYMLLVYPFKKSVQSKVPAVVHVDGSGRLQTIDEQSNSLYYRLIKAYSKKTGIHLILNTSFNVKGEPIVCTPEDAIKCFLHTEIDYLVLGNYLIKK